MKYPPEDYFILGKPSIGIVILPKTVTSEAWDKRQDELAKIYEPDYPDPEAPDYKRRIRERERYDEKVAEIITSFPRWLREHGWSEERIHGRS